jgi:hypothetical protein
MCGELRAFAEQEFRQEGSPPDRLREVVFDARNSDANPSSRWRVTSVKRAAHRWLPTHSPHQTCHLSPLRPVRSEMIERGFSLWHFWCGLRQSERKRSESRALHFVAVAAAAATFGVIHAKASKLRGRLRALQTVASAPNCRERSSTSRARIARCALQINIQFVICKNGALQRRLRRGRASGVSNVHDPSSALDENHGRNRILAAGEGRARLRDSVDGRRASGAQRARAETAISQPHASANRAAAGQPQNSSFKPSQSGSLDFDGRRGDLQSRNGRVPSRPPCGAHRVLYANPKRHPRCRACVLPRRCAGIAR